VPGFGVETTAAKIGAGVAGVAVAAVAIHAGVTAVRQSTAKKEAETAPLAAFGDDTTKAADTVADDTKAADTVADDTKAAEEVAASDTGKAN